MDRNERENLLVLASGQHGLVSAGQAAALGVSRHMLRTGLDQGWLRPERRGVYAVAGAPPSRWRPVAAAALAVGPEAVISHASAAAIHCLYGLAAGQPEVTVPWSCRPRSDGVAVHRSRSIGGVDVDDRHGLSVTTPVRTLIDVAPRMAERLLGEVVDEGTINRLWTAEQVLARVADLGSQGRPGCRGLNEVLAVRLGEGHPRSRLEQRVARVLRPSVPPFDTNYIVVLDGVVIEMDLAWPIFKIDGEVDGMAVRAASRTKFERQCRRENILAAHGWRIVHFTAGMDDRTMVGQVARLLAGAR